MSHLSAAVDPGWRRERGGPTLGDVYRSVPVVRTASFWRKLAAFAGPGYLVAVGYMDPGNWATSLAGGSAYGYTLLSVIMLSNLMAIFLQALSARLGIVTGRNLAEMCRQQFPGPVVLAMWVVSEIAAMATELRKVGATVEEGPDYIKVTAPEKLTPNAVIDTYDDHRMAMCFSLPSLAGVPIRINDPGCTAKTFPTYWDVFKGIAQ